VPDGRDILSLFIGSIRTSQAPSRELRKKLHEQCRAEGAPACEWRKTAHACNGVVNASDAMLLFKRARYCPAPPGDSLTRKVPPASTPSHRGPAVHFHSIALISSSSQPVLLVFCSRCSTRWWPAACP